MKKSAPVNPHDQTKSINSQQLFKTLHPQRHPKQPAEQIKTANGNDAAQLRHGKSIKGNQFREQAVKAQQGQSDIKKQKTAGGILRCWRLSHSSRNPSGNAR